MFEKSERRRSPRQDVMRAGHIEYAGRRRDCIIRNISDHGAAIDLIAPVPDLPSSFVLEITADHSWLRCRVVWQADSRIGVEFIPPGT